MKVDVYDTYATGRNGKTIHFDVLVPSGATAEAAFQYAQKWLAQVGLSEAALTQSRCNFCHTEAATHEVASSIEKVGHYITRMEGCPKNYSNLSVTAFSAREKSS